MFGVVLFRVARGECSVQTYTGSVFLCLHKLQSSLLSLGCGNSSLSFDRYSGRWFSIRKFFLIIISPLGKHSKLLITMFMGTIYFRTIHINFSDILINIIDVDFLYFTLYTNHLFI